MKNDNAKQDDCEYMMQTLSRLLSEYKCDSTVIVVPHEPTQPVMVYVAGHECVNAVSVPDITLRDYLFKGRQARLAVLNAATTVTHVVKQPTDEPKPRCKAIDGENGEPCICHAGHAGDCETASGKTFAPFASPLAINKAPLVPTIGE